ncbi:hypothetical protein FB451DRAFT_312841 [Mycena latifolia]|nr:hypothetical protein FB451DRAFT_312841 [Mycena latifolia]
MSHSGLSPQHFLLLIENSATLAPFWSDLRDCYLPRLVEQLSGSHPRNLTNIFISESRPAHDFHNSGIRPYNSLKDGFQQFEFNYELDNRLSTTQIQTAVEFLSSTTLATPQVRHLIVVAATPPAEFANRSLHDPWQVLANLITQGDIHLHLALTSNLRSGTLPNLFEQTLQSQQNIEEPLWLPKYSTAFIFRVSAQQTYSNSVLPGTKAGPSSSSNLRGSRDNIPSDIYTTKSLDEVASESPSLVSQLQQYHGLTKKKVYGAKPPRIPFVKDERVRDRYRGAPTRLLMPPSFPIPPENGAPPLLTRGGRTRSRKKAADRAVTSRYERDVDPYVLRQAPWYQPMSSPEGDSSDQSPYSSSNLSLPPSPVAPLSAADNYTFANAPNSLIAGQPAVTLEQPWARPPTASDNPHAPFYPPVAPAPPLPSFGPRDSDACPLRGSHAPFHLDLGAMHFQDSPCEPLSADLESPPFVLSPLSSPAYITLPRSDNFDTECGGQEFGTAHFQQLQHDPYSFPFPIAAALPPLAHAPPAHGIPEGQWAMPILQPTPMLPPISAPELQDRVEGLVAAASQSLEAQAKARHTSPAPCATASVGSAFASSSSSLTGWAG